MRKSIKKYCYFLGFIAVFLLLINFNLISVAASTAKWVMDGASIYVSVLDDNIVLPSGSISASPNPCAIVSPATVCNSTISWQTTSAPNTCIFMKGSDKLFACGQSGNSNAPWIDANGVTFELREKNDINSKILASVFVKGEIQTAPLLTLNVSTAGAGRGFITAQGINCPVDCQESYLKETSVTLTATPDSNSRFINWSGDCLGTNLSCVLTMNNNKSTTANFEIVTTSQSFCSTGNIRACIDFISPDTANQGQDIIFTGHGENDSNKSITAYRWRLDNISGKTLISRESTFSINAISPGIHTIYFRVSVGKTFGGWSGWISKEFTVLSSSNSSSSSSNNSLSSLSSSSLSVPSTNIPVAPVDLTITLGGKPSPNTRTLFLRWKDMSSNEDKFEIEWKFTKQAFSSKWIRVNLPANQDNYSFNALVEKERIYYYRVRACNNNGCSGYVEK